VTAYPSDGKCTYCGTRAQSKPRYRIIRHGGGAYNRAGRNYPGQICVDCAEALTRNIDESRLYAMQTVARYPARTLLAIAKTKEQP
jgi:ribosomal protein L34E